MNQKSLNVFVIALLILSLFQGLTSYEVSAQNAPFEDSEINDIMDNMSLEEKVGQLFIVHVYGEEAEDPDYEDVNLDNDRGGKNFKEVIENYNVGGVIYFNWTDNITEPVDISKTNQLSNDIQEIALEHKDIPLFVSTDQEGGIVQRVREPGTTFPGNMALGATRSEKLAFESAAVIGKESKALGINMNFAPTVDVNSNYKNPVIGVRSFSEDPDLVTSLGVAQVQGYQSIDVMGSVKHFPGHGDTDVDSHHGLPVIDRSEEELFEVDLRPFKQAMDEGIEAVMTGHIVVPALDDTEMPATLSKAILTNLLREEFDYDGLIITDSLGMSGANILEPEEVPVQAILAGNDILLNPPNVDLAYNAVLEAVKDGTISEDRLDESVYRILKAKKDKDLFNNPFTPVEAVEDIGKDEHKAKAKEIAEKSITLVENKDRILPLDVEQNIYVMGLDSSAKGDILKRYLEDNGHQIVDEDSEADVIVIATFNVTESELQVEEVESYVKSDTPVIVIAMQNPYDLIEFPEVDGYLTTYSNFDVSVEAAANVISGNINPTGKLPVSIPGLYEMGHSLNYLYMDDLEKLIEEAKKISNEDEQYTNESYEALLNTINEAEYMLEHADTQEEIDAVYEELSQALNNLEEVPEIDTRELEALIKKAKEISNKDNEYTDESFKNLQSAIKEAENILETAENQDEVNRAYEHLQKAHNDLERTSTIEKPLDVSKLEELIDKSATITSEEEKYTEKSFLTFKKALEHAKNVLNTAETQKEVDLAYERLDEAIEHLEEIPKGKKAEKETIEKGEKLPKTATSNYYYITVGTIFILLGSIVAFVIYKRKQKFL